MTNAQRIALERALRTLKDCSLTVGDLMVYQLHKDCTDVCKDMNSGLPEDEQVTPAGRLMYMLTDYDGEILDYIDGAGDLYETANNLGLFNE